MQIEKMKTFISNTLEDIKAEDVKILDVREMTSVTDYMFICTATSNRHAKAIAQSLITKSKEQGLTILGHEGVDLGEWALVDLGDVVVHIMLEQKREFYNLEKLWGAVALARENLNEN